MGIEVTRLGRSTHTVRVAVEYDKTVDIDISHRVGVGGDEIRVRFEGMPVLTNTPLQLNLKPGLGGLDLVTAAPPGSVATTVSGTIGGVRLDGKFSLPVDGGGRLSLSSLTSRGDLRIGRIGSLFGPVQDYTLVSPL